MAGEGVVSTSEQCQQAPLLLPNSPHGQPARQVRKIPCPRGKVEVPMWRHDTQFVSRLPIIPQPRTFLPYSTSLKPLLALVWPGVGPLQSSCKIPLHILLCARAFLRCVLLPHRCVSRPYLMTPTGKWSHVAWMCWTCPPSCHTPCTSGKYTHTRTHAHTLTARRCSQRWTQGVHAAWDLDIQHPLTRTRARTSPLAPPLSPPPPPLPAAAHI